MESTPMARRIWVYQDERAKKYRELDSKERANYWALMNLLHIYQDVWEDYQDGWNEGHSKLDDPTMVQIAKSVSILETNLNIELFTDEEKN